MDIKKAYEIMGLPDGAGLEDVTRKYDMLIRQQRADKLSGVLQESDKERFDEIDRAYTVIARTLKGENTEQAVADGTSAPSLAKKLGAKTRKFSSVFYYYKVYVFLGVMAIVTLILLSRGAFTDNTADINVILLGDVPIDNISTLEASITDNMPEVENPVVQSLFIPEYSTQQNEVMERTKATTLIAAGEADVFILDKKMFYSLAYEGAFMSLDELVEELGIDKEANKDYIVKVGNSGEERFCGIDASDSTFLKDAGLTGDEFIIAMRPKEERYKIAVDLVKILLE